VTGHGAGGPAPKRIIVGYGFWIFLLSDVIMFSSFFAAYAVLFKNTAGGPAAQQLFDLRNTAVETACLLGSTFTCAMANAARSGHRLRCWPPGCSALLSSASNCASSRAWWRAALVPRAAPSCPHSSPWSGAMGRM
jgi:hypothetical protein